MLHGNFIFIHRNFIFPCMKMRNLPLTFFLSSQKCSWVVGLYTTGCMDFSTELTIIKTPKILLILSVHKKHYYIAITATRMDAVNKVWDILICKNDFLGICFDTLAIKLSNKTRSPHCRKHQLLRYILAPFFLEYCKSMSEMWSPYTVCPLLLSLTDLGLILDLNKKFIWMSARVYLSHMSVRGWYMSNAETIIVELKTFIYPLIIT